MAVKNLIKQAGLWTNVNTQGSYPEGAMLEAKNVVIDKDDIVESRRGFKVYGDDLGLVGSRAKQLLNFSDTLIRHYNDVLQYESNDASGEFTSYSSLNWKYAASGELTSTGLTASFTSIRPHGLENNDVVVISGASPAQYNGTFTVDVIDEDTFEYQIPGVAASPASGNAVVETSTSHIDQVDIYNKIRGVETPNGNYYFTSDTGIKKLDDVNNFIRDAGAPKALDVQLETLDVENAEVLPENSQVAYRTLWGYKDLNNNLILGTPSTRTTIGLATSSLVISDFNTLLNKIDAAAAANTTGVLDETDYNTLTISDSSDAIALNGALKALASKLELDLEYFGVTESPRYGRELHIVEVSTGNPATVETSEDHALNSGDQVTLSGSNAIPDVNGQYNIDTSGTPSYQFKINVQTAVTTTGTNVGLVTTGIAQDYPTPALDTANSEEAFISQQEFFDAIVNLLLSEPLDKIDAGSQAAGNFQNAVTAKTVQITFTVPQDITPNYFYQIYRTLASGGLDVDPGDDMGLVYEGNPTAEEIIQGYVQVIDNTPEDFRGPNLYTNPRQEGILQSNEPPPFAKDLAVFKNILFFANTQVRHKLKLSLLGVTNLVGTSLLIGDEVYTFSTTEDVNSAQVKVYTDGTPGQNLDDTARSLVKVINRFPDNISIYAYYLSQADQVPGQILLEARTLQDGKFYVLSSNPTIGSTNFSPSVAPENNPITAISVGPNPTITTTSNHNLKVGNTVVLSGTNNGIDGAYYVESVTSNTFTIIRLVFSAAGTSGAFKNGANALGVSSAETLKNRLFYSKQNEYEAVPIVNYFDVGSGDKDIVRVLPLRDSLFVLKTDGVYRITGDTTSNLNLSLFDNTTNVIGADTAVVGNNQIHTFTTQGVVVISDTGVQIISRPIENQLLPLTPNVNILTEAFAVFYQTDRKYILFLPMTAAAQVATRAFVYNNITNAWTLWDMSKTCGIVNSRDDKMYLGASDINNIEQERKNFSRSDFADREYALTVTEYDAVNKIIKLSSVINLQPGDVLLQTQTYDNSPYGTFDYEVEAVVLSKNQTTGEVTINTVYPYVLGNITLYKSYECKVQWQPDTINDQGDLKHFREAILRFRKSRITKPIMGFSSDLQASVNEVPLTGVGPGLGNWGYFPWGGVPWGGDVNQRGFRTYVPIGKQRCSMLNIYFRQDRAREDWQLEGLAVVFEISSPRINR